MIAEPKLVFSNSHTIHNLLSHNAKRMKPSPSTPSVEKLSEWERKFYSMNSFLVAEVFVDYISKYGMSEEGLYRINGEEKTIQKIIKAVSKNKPIPLKTDIFAVGTAWKRHIKCSTHPIIPSSTTSLLIDTFAGVNTKDIASIIQNQLSFEQFRTLRFIMQHLNNITLYQHKNRMTTKGLAILFAPILFRLDDFNDPLASLKLLPQMANCLQVMLDSFEVVFDGEENQSPPLQQENEPTFAMDDTLLINAKDARKKRYAIRLEFPSSV